MFDSHTDHLRVAIAQISPVWLDREKTTEKILDSISSAANGECRLVSFGEALLPGYPFWVSLTDGARFESSLQKEIHAHYLDQAVQIERGDLGPITRLASDLEIGVYLGCIERAADRGGHSVFASLVFIDTNGEIRSVHRKLIPTYEERLTWAPGDGNGLRVHPIGSFTAGGLNCWENWMPLTRTALYAQGEDLHVAVWPGSVRNTEDITRFVAKESRSYVLSASGLMRRTDFPANTPHLDEIVADCPEVLADGGSCIAAPDGSWVIEPVMGEEKILIADLDHRQVRRERQNFDPAGHYSRPDVTRLTVDRSRQSVISFKDS